MSANHFRGDELGMANIVVGLDVKIYCDIETGHQKGLQNVNSLQSTPRAHWNLKLYDSPFFVFVFLRLASNTPGLRP